LTLRNEVNLLLEDLGRHEEALERAERLEDPYQRVEIHWLHALLTTDWNRADSIAAGIADDVLSPAWVREEAMVVRASAHAGRGAVAAASRYLSAASAIAADEGRPDRLRRNELSRLALAFAAPGASSGSRPAVQHDVDAPLAMAHRAFEEAVLGDTAVTGEILGRLREFPREQRPQGSWMKLLEASLLARAGRWAEVPAALHRANPGPARDGAESILVWWLLADAYARLGEPDSAAAYLDKLGDSQAVARVTGSVSRVSGSAFIGMLYPFAHQRLTVLHARAGRIEEARRHWSIFSRTFTDPDPELRHLIDEAWQALLEGAQDQGDRARTPRAAQRGTLSHAARRPQPRSASPSAAQRVDHRTEPGAVLVAYGSERFMRVQHTFAAGFGIERSGERKHLR
jgi:tetratricopeptide (TPR) repeat protein